MSISLNCLLNMINFSTSLYISMASLYRCCIRYSYPSGNIVSENDEKTERRRMATKESSKAFYDSVKK